MTAKMTDAVATENANGSANAVRSARTPRMRASSSSTTKSAPSTAGTTEKSVNSAVVASTLPNSPDSMSR